MTPEDLAKLFHSTYEELAPQFSYETRVESAKPWDEVPQNNRELMIATADAVMRKIDKKMARERRAIATAIDILDRTTDVEAPLGAHNALAALRFGVGLDVTDEEIERLKVIDPDLLELP